MINKLKTIVLMKKLVTLLLCLSSLGFTACGDKDEQMEYASIYFPLATRAESNGLFMASFDFDRDTTFIIGAYCAGSIFPPQDIVVGIDLATDSLAVAAQTDATLAGLTLLPVDTYEVEPASMQAVIREGTERGDLKFTFHLQALDPGTQYVLPLKIVSTSHYVIAPKYECVFFGIKKK